MEVWMKKWNLKSKLLVALVPTVMLLATSGEAHATVTVIEFNYTGSMVDYQVKTTGTTTLPPTGPRAAEAAAAAAAWELKSEGNFP
jgi:hypothetical protein